MLSLALVLALAAVTAAGQSTELQEKTVRAVYLVSRDRPVLPEYRDAIEHALRELQAWYGGQMGGPTFHLHDPVVEVARSAEPASWFYGNPNGTNQDDWGFNNTLAEASRLLGAKSNDPRFIWVIYSDGPGNKGRGGSGVCVLPEDDLLGLVGRHPTQKKAERWVGGLGHELGHAFGLAHPADTRKDAEALMWAGFYDQYPGRAYLTTGDKQILSHSPFFFDASGNPLAAPLVFVEKYSYPGGYFGRVAGDGQGRWLEVKTNGDAGFSFDEVRRDAGVILLKDAGRGTTIEIPLPGGQLQFSTDGGATFRPLYTVTRE
jgi:hypothetical protein